MPAEFWIVIGATGMLILVIISETRRLCKKFAELAHPTFFTYVNQLGGYAVIGVIIAVKIGLFCFGG